MIYAQMISKYLLFPFWRR